MKASRMAIKLGPGPATIGGLVLPFERDENDGVADDLLGSDKAGGHLARNAGRCPEVFVGAPGEKPAAKGPE